MLDDPASKLTALGCSSGGASAGAGAGAPSSLTTTCTDGPANNLTYYYQAFFAVGIAKSNGLLPRQ